MMMSRHDSRGKWPALLLACVLLTAGFGVAPSAQASGTYVGRPAGPPGPLESARYHLGKKIFKGKVVLAAAQLDAAKLEQRTTELKACQAKLPARTKAKVDLPALAPKLNDALRGVLGERPVVDRSVVDDALSGRRRYAFVNVWVGRAGSSPPPPLAAAAAATRASPAAAS